MDSVMRDPTGGWRAGAEIIGFALAGPDGTHGQVQDFIVEEECGAIVEILVALPGGKELLIPATAVERIDWRERTVYAASEELVAPAIDPRAYAAANVSALCRPADKAGF
jgi:hypothetical protein